MNRDSTPTPAAITMATTELFLVVRRTWHKLAANYGLTMATAVGPMAVALGEFWPSTPPESARDALCISARAAVIGGITKVPMQDADLTASTLLELTADWLAANPGHEVTGAPIGPPGNPPLAFASSCAFDRDEETLRSLAVLCVLAEMAAKPEMYPPMAHAPAGAEQLAPPQIWLPHSGVMITCCPVHASRRGPRRTHEEVAEIAACRACTKETLAEPLQDDEDSGTAKPAREPVEYEVPAELTAETGLTSWPERGSELAPLAVMAWEHARRRVTMTYEQQDALWRVTEMDGRSDPPSTVSSELFTRAVEAYEAALDIIVSPLP